MCKAKNKKPKFVEYLEVFVELFTLTNALSNGIILSGKATYLIVNRNVKLT